MDAYTQTQLRERGWTIAAIKRFLGEPDYVGSCSPSRWYYLYEQGRVHAAEVTVEHRAWRDQSAVRSARARSAADQRRARLRELASDATDRLLQEVREWQPRLDVADSVTLDDVIGWAIEDHNERQRAYCHEPWYASRKSDPAFLHRIAVNYLRHQCSDYDDILDTLRARLGEDAACRLARRRIHDAIAERFPALADACDAQDQYRRNQDRSWRQRLRKHGITAA